MKLNELKQNLDKVNTVKIKLPDGNIVPEHFHLTEAGMITRHFIDCGGVERMERKINLQLWVADDYEHRLSPTKFKGILRMAERTIGFPDLLVEIEYQKATVCKYHLDFDGEIFHLRSTMTDCLAKDKCGIPTQDTECAPDSGCC